MKDCASWKRRSEVIGRLARFQNPQSEIACSFIKRGFPLVRGELNPKLLGHYLSGVIPEQWGTLTDFNVRLLSQHRRRRMTLAIALETTSGKRELIGKLHSTDRADVYRAMKQISNAGFGPEMEYSIPTPVGYIPELHLLLQERVCGLAATDIFSKGSEPEQLITAERCARWLGHFHTHAPPVGPTFELTAERLEDWVRRLANPLKALELKARRLSDRVLTTVAALKPAQTCGCHGGYWHQNIILSEARVVAIDWDNHCIGDPARDVAKFIIELEQLALRSFGSTKALDDLIERFCKTYSATSKWPVAANLPLYKAALSLKRAKYHLRRGGMGVEQAEAMLDEGLRYLTQEV